MGYNRRKSYSYIESQILNMSYSVLHTRSRNHNSHDRAFSRGATNGELTSEQQGPLVHSQNSQGSTGRKLLFTDSAPVIANFEDNNAILPPQPDIHASCLRVTRDVGQCLLEDPKNRRGRLWIGGDIPIRQIQPALGPGASLELLRGPL